MVLSWLVDNIIVVVVVVARCVRLLILTFELLALEVPLLLLHAWFLLISYSSSSISGRFLDLVCGFSTFFDCKQSEEVAFGLEEVLDNLDEELLLATWLLLVILFFLSESLAKARIPLDLKVDLLVVSLNQKEKS